MFEMERARKSWSEVNGLCRSRLFSLRRRLLRFSLIHSLTHSASFLSLSLSWCIQRSPTSFIELPVSAYILSHSSTFLHIRHSAFAPLVHYCNKQRSKISRFHFDFSPIELTTDIVELDDGHVRGVFHSLCFVVNWTRAEDTGDQRVSSGAFVSSS